MVAAHLLSWNLAINGWYFGSILNKKTNTSAMAEYKKLVLQYAMAKKENRMKKENKNAENV